MAQNTLLAFAPLMSLNDVAVAVTRVVAVWNTHWASELPCASSVTVAAENKKLPIAEQYTPGVSTTPARSALCRVWSAVHVAVEACLYRVWRLAAQLFARGVLLSSAPEVIAYEPAMKRPGETPTEPVCTTVLAPLKLTAVPARTAKFEQSPRASGTDATPMLKDLLAVGGRVIVAPLAHDMAVRASALPFKTELEPKLTPVFAMMFPTKLLEDPRVTEVPTAQKTF